MSKDEAYFQAYNYAVDKLKDAKKDNFATLRRQIIVTGVCTSCGACIASCEAEVLDMVAGRPTLVGKCTNCGVCLHQCPRTITTPEGLLGDYKFARRGKSNLKDLKGQDGGIVTTLLAYALDENLIDSAIVTTKSDEVPWKPIPAIVTNSKSLLSAAGTIYNQCQENVGALVQAIKMGMHSIGFVGTPCHIDAVTKMEESPLGLFRLYGRVKILKIGLFCMDSFTYERLVYFLQEVKGIPISSITKMDISKGKFLVTYDGDKTESWRIHEMDNLRTSSCYYCTDLTNEQADISVGSVGSPEGYSTILARTSDGVQILQDAEEKGFLTTEPFTRAGLQAVLNLARMKKVQLYTMRRRRRYIIDNIEFTAPSTKVQSVTLETETAAAPSTLEPGVYRRRVIQTKNIRLIDDATKIGMKLINTSGCVIESVKIQIGHFQDLFEDYAWQTSVDLWFPAEELEFEFKRVENDSKYLLHIEDKQGKILTKKIEVANLEK
ncbi:MAG: Coenzyme F420 hydrogenase/dehydrogenase, beta subunit C-terminal domain [Candidatus Heimdallarchaeota archaeon]